MSQVLNMLRGLSSKYRHAISAITARQTPHTFLSARSYLLLEEQYDKEHAKMTTQQALVASSGSCPPTPTTGDGGSSSAPAPPPPLSGTGNVHPCSDNRNNHG
jgi:hypothetical protein